jgi:hypothetical protein
MRALHGVVVQVLAHHSGRAKSSIHPWQNLERDLDMTPLEVVLVVLEIEGLEDVDIQVEGLEEVTTVGELSSFVKREVAREKLARRSLEVA